ADAAAEQVCAHEAAAAAVSARQLTTRADRASELHAVYGDTAPASVADDASLSRQVTVGLTAWRSMPPQPSAPSRTSQQLREELSALPAPPKGDVEEDPTVLRALDRVRFGQAQAAPPRRRRATALLVAGALVVVIGVLLLITGDSAVGIAGVALGAALLFGGALTRQRHTELHREVMAAAAELARALAERGHPSDGLDVPKLVAAAEQYREACRVRATEALEARRRAGLTAQLADCEAAEARAARDAQERNRAGELVIAAARACSLPAQTPQEATEALDEWSRQRETQRSTLSRAYQEWAELRALLGGGSLADLVQSRRSAADTAAELAAAVDQTLLVSVDEATAGDRLPGLRQAASAAQTQAATAEGELRTLAATIGSVAEAEEDLEAAKSTLERVRQLGRTLDRTRKFLQTAQTDVHRQIAPVLTETIESWLPAVTGGRYTDVMVDPTSLQVTVRDPTQHWRSADQLSHGTAEQIYLLLRVALVDYLTIGHDTCPLLLDDVTVHADAARTRDILDLLLRLSAQRQIVVFSQEAQVAAWARQHLTIDEHRIVNLPVVVG
ncbi:MAG: ATP-binding protein, partial [Pseudonocardiaceae bacterium]